MRPEVRSTPPSKGTCFASVLGVGVWGPGLPGWADSQAVLQGLLDHSWVEGAVPAAPFLSANERRRTGLSVRLALAVAHEACVMAGAAPNALASVFATSNGDGPVVHAILETLASADPQVSPTQFHNSVQNAAAGYWSIGTSSLQPAACLACHDGTFAAALLKAAAELQVERRPVLLCLYDTPLPAPLDAARPTRGAFGAAFVLGPRPCGGALAEVGVRYVAEPPDTACSEPGSPGLRRLAAVNPAARCLSLLEALARAEPAVVHAELLDARVELEVRPC